MSALAKLMRALSALAQAAGCAVRIAPMSERRWASATFVGARHILAIEGSGSAALDAWLDTLADADYAVRGHFVADVTVERHACGAQVTALILESG